MNRKNVLLHYNKENVNRDEPLLQHMTPGSSSRPKQITPLSTNITNTIHTTSSECHQYQRNTFKRPRIPLPKPFNLMNIFNAVTPPHITNFNEPQLRNHPTPSSFTENTLSPYYANINNAACFNIDTSRHSDSDNAFDHNSEEDDDHNSLPLGSSHL